MLFTAPLFKLFQGINRVTGLTIRGYVDNDLFTVCAKSENVSTEIIQAAFGKVEKWADENGMVSDLDKFEAMYFSRKRNYPNPKIILPAYISPDHTIPKRTIKPLGKNTSMKWLGVYFDHKLSFTDHANKMASNGRKAATGLTMLVKTTRGVNATTMRKAVHACILPIFTYAAPAWWPGQSHTNAAGRTIHNKINANCDKLNKAQNIALRTILPVWKTVPIHIFQRKVATPPIHHTLDYLCKLAALRLHKLKARHLLCLKTKHAYTTAAPSRIERLAQKCAKEVEYSDPMLGSEPWEEHLFGGREKCLKAKSGIWNKERAKTKFNAWLQYLNPLD